MRSMKHMSEYLYTVAVKGVDYDLEGNGGPECVNFIPMWQRLFETTVFVPLGIYCISLAWDYLEWPARSTEESRDEDQIVTENGKDHSGTSNGSVCNGTTSAPGSSCEGKANGVAHEPTPVTTPPLDQSTTPFQQQLEDLRLWILGFYVAIFALELGYKIWTKTGIFLANPCHQTTMLQLILLTLGKDNPRVTQIFRFQMYVMPGAFFALAFPILNTRLLIGEVFVYFVQHVFILIIPFYLLCLGGHYRPETYHNLAWPMFSMSIIVLYHFVFLQSLGYMTLVNLNCILCPAISDPLGNRFWRIAAFTHQCILVPILSKSYSYYGQLVASYFIAAHEEKDPTNDTVKVEEQKKCE